MREMPNSPHFDFQELAPGVFAALHKWGGAAYSNCGIIDLGDETLVVDAADNLLAGRDLRAAAEQLTGRVPARLVLTHGHDDHWLGAQAFGLETTLIAQEVVAAEINTDAEEFDLSKARPEYEEWLGDTQKELAATVSPRRRLGLERTITRIEYALQVLPDMQPVAVDQRFDERLDISGIRRRVEVVHKGPVHSSSDTIIYLPDDGVAFVGDIGFFGLQPFMRFCKLDAWRAELTALLASEYQVMMPGHGIVGGDAEIRQMLGYFDVMEQLVGAVVARGGSLEDAKQIALPEPYANWLMGSITRFELNVEFLYEHLKSDD